jgi:hypothetical protein
MIETGYDPAIADAGAVTCSVVDALAPGLTVSIVVPKLVVQPDVAAGDRLKFDEPHAGLLRLVNETVRDVAPPGLIDACDGDSVRVGADTVHDDVV